MSETYLPATPTKREPPSHDIFGTPKNSDFISKIQYQSLSITEREIRLLKILPSSRSTLIKCELLPSVKLVDVQKKYLALSYCAGSPKETQTILINGVKCNVFANLHHALMEARHYWRPFADQQDLLLWVDQICINQFDLAERSHQVGFMRDIYEKATQTLICLSTSSAHGMGMKWLIMQRHDLELDNVDAFHLSNIDGREKAFESRWAASLGVAMSPWWGRAWVFQEFMVSTQATFLYGGHSMPYLDFAILAAGFPGSEIPPSDQISAALELTFRNEKIEGLKSRMRGFLVAKLQKSKTTNLKLLLAYTRNCQATDTRDKLYSILGLADPGYGIIPDYSDDININDLMVETTKKIILFDDSLEVLSYQDRNKPFYLNSRVTLPSWVLDWTGIASFKSLSYISDYDESFKFVGPKSDEIAPTSPDVIFLQVPHPQNPEAQISVVQVWAALLDDQFYETQVGETRHRFFEGFRGFRIREGNGQEVSSDYEMWAIRGTVEPFFLRKYSYGYQLVGPACCENMSHMIYPGIRIDISKMQQTRITIF